MSLCIACLSYKKPKILQSTLDTYQANGLLDYADEKIVYFNEVSAKDEVVAKKYDFHIMGSDKNVGIGRAFKTISTNAKSDYILFLENDFSLIEKKETVIKQLDAAKALIEQGVPVIKLRHRINPGAPLYSKGKVINTHLLGMLHWAKELPVEIRSGTHEEVPYWYTEAKHANYTNNPCLYNREWFNATVVPFCTGPGVALEGDIQKWWQKQTFLVAQTEGLFTHGFLK